MVHLHSLLSSDTNSGRVPASTSGKSGEDGFRGLLSEAGSAGDETSAGRSSITPGSWDKFARVAPPPPTSSSASAGGAAGASTGAAESNYDPFLQYVNSTSAPSQAKSSSIPATSGAPAPAASTTLTAQQAFDDAYWAAQPAAVQALRDASADDRVQMATQLAQEGYSIDVPIMVWGWDPYTTTNTRVADGYTWVPSAMQSSVSSAPGVSFDGASYNASDPPAGSIAV
jgi:hypothetical protein